MQYEVKNNPEGCVCKERLANYQSCGACYRSQVNESNQWTGSQKCWDAQCIVAQATDAS